MNSADLSGFRKTEKKLDGFDIQLNKANIENQINQLSAERQKCYERFVGFELDREEFQSLKADYSKQIDRLAKQLTVIGQTERKHQTNMETATLAKDALGEISDYKDIIDALIERVLVFPNNHIEIEWKFKDFAEVG